MMEQKNNSIESEVLDKIKSGQAKMRPQWYFVSRTVLMVVGLVFLAVAILYLVTFVVFTLRKTGIIYAPDFGWNGLRTFFVSLPWLLIILAIIFIGLLEHMVKKYAFAYRKPLLYSLLAIVVFVTVGGVVIVRAKIHEELFERAMNRRLPVAGDLYRGYGSGSVKNVKVGIIQEITPQGFIMTDDQGQIVNVIVWPQTRFPRGIDFVPGDEVFIIGSSTDTMVDALGVRRVDHHLRAPAPMMPAWNR